MYGKGKRTYKELRIVILKSLKKNDQTIYDISNDTKLHFHVVKRHLIFLKGMDYAKVAFEHNRFRLYSITASGKKYLRKLTR